MKRASKSDIMKIEFKSNRLFPYTNSDPDVLKQASESLTFEELFEIIAHRPEPSAYSELVSTRNPFNSLRFGTVFDPKSYFCCILGRLDAIYFYP